MWKSHLSPHPPASFVREEGERNLVQKFSGLPGRIFVFFLFADRGIIRSANSKVGGKGESCSFEWPTGFTFFRRFSFFGETDLCSPAVKNSGENINYSPHLFPEETG